MPHDNGGVMTQRNGTTPGGEIKLIGHYVNPNLFIS
jgi:hypothetical protein